MNKCGLASFRKFIAGCLFLSNPFWNITLSQADSSSPKLAAYYDRKMVLCGDIAYQWEGDGHPHLVSIDTVQVGVGRDASYSLDQQGRLFAWRDTSDNRQIIFENAIWFAAGRSGVFVLTADHNLWFLERSEHWFREGDIGTSVHIADNVKTASIGDSANYYITLSGDLYVKGKAHRGQYGDGKLQSTDVFVKVAQKTQNINAHTGHAILRTQHGIVMGTGGNIYGPIGLHGLGDKAIKWGAIFEGATAIATGSSHSLAIMADGSLWSWGRDVGLKPKKVLANVVAVAADNRGSIALR
ncbi:MAG: hypothetical protein JKX94_04170, partial [Sneathiella sp.]|nr:hypothetical protein [Sneathiella sp.]